MKVRAQSMQLAGIGAPLSLLAAACSPSGGGAAPLTADDGPFACAALISAADRLITTGQVPADETITNQGLVAAMTHLNIWAIPQRLDERQAFDRVNQERDRLLAETAPADIVARAKVCIAQV